MVEETFTVGLPGDEDDEPSINYAALTNDAVFRRLGIEGLGGTVLIRPGGIQKPTEGGPEQVSLLSAMMGILVELELPYANIQIAGADD